jgi:hypothetical protein
MFKFLQGLSEEDEYQNENNDIRYAQIQDLKRRIEKARSQLFSNQSIAERRDETVQELRPPVEEIVDEKKQKEKELDDIRAKLRRKTT